MVARTTGISSRLGLRHGGAKVMPRGMSVVKAVWEPKSCSDGGRCGPEVLVRLLLKGEMSALTARYGNSI